MNLQHSGLAIVPSSPPSMGIIVQPGHLSYLGKKIEVLHDIPVSIRIGGQRRYEDQVYTIRGEGTVSPSWWNGEDIRGSGGTPYQRIVPHTLSVYNKNRDVLYTPETDYVFDYHWGTIKRNPQGKITAAEELSLDYDVWLCRYDAIVLHEDGSIVVVEGESDAPESRELLLPEPPVVKEGFVLAHIFTGWGQKCIYSGPSSISDASDAAPQVKLHGKYEDMVHRTYYIDITPNSAADKSTISIGATGDDYGTSDILTKESLRWTKPRPFAFGQEQPLSIDMVYGFEVDWGLSVEFTQTSADTWNKPARYTVEAIPEMIFDMKPLLNGTTPLDFIPLEQSEHLDGFRQGLVSGKPTRIAYFGESASRSGLWPYQVIQGLRTKYPDTKIYSSNVATGGEQSIMGIKRLEKEVLTVQADLIILEYLINDACSGYSEATIEQIIRTILEQISATGVPCMIVMVNGVNPVFTPYGSKRILRQFYNLYRRLAAEYQVAFVGGFNYFDNLHRFGKYFITELKGNMVNHSFGNEDLTWGPFDQVLSSAILEELCRDK